MTLPNNQPIEPRAVTDGRFVEVHSYFNTIQGEGPFSGSAAFFIRLAGCNLQCPLCDTDYTGMRAQYRVDEIVEIVADNARSKLVVITGGEPFRQNISLLVDNLIRLLGYTVQIETNGRLAPQGMPMYNRLLKIPHNRLHVVISPKTERVHPDANALATAWKYVIRAEDVYHDGLPRTALDNPISTGRVIARPGPDFHGDIYVQPADEQNDEKNALNLDAAVSAVLQHPKERRRLGVQVHKYAGLE